VLSQVDAGRVVMGDTETQAAVAGANQRGDTRIMGSPLRRGLLLAAMCLAALPAFADEIRLKDGKKLYGVIVSYEENMFKVKTDFGYVLVEKDKIASIIPTAPANSAAGSESQPTAKKENADQPKPGANAQGKAESATSSGIDAKPGAVNASVKTTLPANGKHDSKIASKVSNAPVKPELPANATTEAVAPTIKATPTPAGTSLAASTVPPAAPKAPEVPAIHEVVQGSVYTNYTHGFRMYKAPSWQLIDDARNALPNAIVAMGTSNESTLMVVGREKTKESLDGAAATVEKRLREVYENYRQVSQRKTTVGGSPAIEFHYVGKADDHDWSGTLVVIGRGSEVFTVLGMTYADSDLIQIQENVIAKAIASLSFDVH